MALNFLNHVLIGKNWCASELTTHCLTDVPGSVTPSEMVELHRDAEEARLAHKDRRVGKAGCLYAPFFRLF